MVEVREPTSSRPPLTSDCDSGRVLALASGACRSKRWREAGDAAHRLLMSEFLTTCKHIGRIALGWLGAHDRLGDVPIMPLRV